MKLGTLDDILEIEDLARNGAYVMFPLTLDITDPFNDEATNKQSFIMLAQPDDQIQYLFPFYEVTSENALTFWPLGYNGIVDEILNQFDYTEENEEE